MTVEFLSAIIEHVAHPIFVKDREFRFVLVNRALCDMVGYSREAMLGKTDYDFFRRSEADFFRQKDTEVFSSGEPAVIEEEPITDADGEVHILETIKVPRRDDSGEVTHLVGIINDITKMRRTEEALRLANEELGRRVDERTRELDAAQEALVRKERLAVLGQLAGGLAHQLRNPLGAIQNAVALFRREPLTESQGELLAIIYEEVKRADRTITDLLDFARIRNPERREVQLRLLVEDVLDLVRPPAGVSVRISGGDGVLAFVDPVQLQTALENIVQNALDAMPNGGQLNIVIGRGTRALEIEVTDDGEGVPELARRVLFDPLVTTKSQGVGLGLSTARNLIENHGGAIRYAPAEGRGSTFIIELPER